ncbi:hypothetical protein JL722_1656 [Aureococcus anophagefferens]|nr:hypothetical protein JL722_1656 [Aureococcus anophagefferens]
MAALQAPNLFGVAGKRVLVTGGGSGIGAMMAAGFAANGASVIIASRNAEALAATAAEVKKTTSADIETVVADLGSRAGRGGRRGASAVMVGSVAGLTHQPTPTHAYDTSKAALHSLTKKFASDLAPKVTVNAIAPGFVPSRMTKGLEAWGITLDGIAKHVPLGRVGAAADMAGAALFFSSPAGSWIPERLPRSRIAWGPKFIDEMKSLPMGYCVSRFAQVSPQKEQ